MLFWLLFVNQFSSFILCVENLRRLLLGLKVYREREMIETLQFCVNFLHFLGFLDFFDFLLNFCKITDSEVKIEKFKVYLANKN